MENPCPICLDRDRSVHKSGALTDTCWKPECRKAWQSQDATKYADMSYSEILADMSRAPTEIACPECSIVFTPKSGQRYCTPLCTGRAYHRAHPTPNKPASARKGPPPLPKGWLTWLTVARRDGWDCYICGTRCDNSDGVYVGASWRSGLSFPTLEHVIPKALGGLHSWANVRLACFRCNSSKGVKAVGTFASGLEVHN